MATMSKLWLPEGNHWGLTILPRNVRSNAGEFVNSTPKMTLHTTEGISFEGARSTLFQNGDEPHLLVSADGKRVQQFIPFNRASKSLRHPQGTQETNRAHCIQMEICGTAATSQDWPRSKYAHLAALCVLIEHRVGIQRDCHVSFLNPNRIPAARFAHFPGYIGHVHVPNNDHVDPGHFRIKLLFELMAKAEEQFGH